MPDPRVLLQILESMWREILKNDGMDFLLEQHTPSTCQALQELQQSQILQAILEEDGLARRTQSSARRLHIG